MTRDSNSWPSRPIDSMCNVVRGSSPRPARDPRYFNGDFLPWVTVGEVTSSEKMHLRSTKTKLTEEGSRQTRILDPGTVILTNSGATLGVPKILCIRAGANDGIAAFLDLNGIEPEFFYFVLQSRTDYMRSSLAPGVGQPNLNTDIIGDIRVPIPQKGEQIKIASILKSWDRTIELSKSLIAAKRKRKNALMQQAYRDPTCQPTQLATVLRRVADSIFPEPDLTYRQIGIRSHGKGLFHKDAVTGASLGNKRVYQVKPNCFVFNVVFAWEQAVARTTFQEAGMIASHRFPMYEPIDALVDIDYLLHFFKTQRGKHLLGLASPGGAGRNRTLSQDAFIKLKLHLPTFAEQSRVSAILNLADREIELLRARVELLKQQKKGLMQQLLTGKTRVKLPKGVA